jgi:hypothetical protein
MAPPDSIFGARERRRIWRSADRGQSVISLGVKCAPYAPRRLKYLGLRKNPVAREILALSG